MRRRFSYFILFFLVSVSEVFSFTGQVVSVLDGDTLEVLEDEKAQPVILQDVNCPGNGQPYGNTASQAAWAWVVVESWHHGQILREVWTGVRV